MFEDKTPTAQQTVIPIVFLSHSEAADPLKFVRIQRNVIP